MGTVRAGRKEREKWRRNYAFSRTNLRVSYIVTIIRGDSMDVLTRWSSSLCPNLHRIKSRFPGNRELRLFFFQKTEPTEERDCLSGPPSFLFPCERPLYCRFFDTKKRIERKIRRVDSSWPCTDEWVQAFSTRLRQIPSSLIIDEIELLAARCARTEL